MKKRINLTSPILLLLTLVGCATAGKDVVPAYVSPIQYSNLDCSQIRDEMARIGSRAAQLTGRLDEASNNDKGIAAVGALVFWPSLFVLGGTKQQEADLSRLKGEYEALEAVSTQKKCSSQTSGSTRSKSKR